MDKCSACVGLDVHEEAIAAMLAVRPGNEEPTYRDERDEIEGRRKPLLPDTRRRSSPFPSGRSRLRRTVNAARACLLAGLATVLAGAGMQARAETLRILMLGDSLTAGYGLASGDALPVRLEAALRDRGLDVQVLNAGVSGDTTAGGLARLDWALADLPHAVIVALGANDALRAIDPAVTRSNLDRLLRTLSERRLPALLAGMLAPRNLGTDYGERFDGIYPELAKHHGALLYPFLLDGVATVSELNQEDGLHPNAAGVEVIVERILPSVLCLAGRAGHTAAGAAGATRLAGLETDCAPAPD